MEIEQVLAIAFATVIILILLVFVMIYIITSLKADKDDLRYEINNVYFELSQMEAAFRDSQHAHMRTTMQAEELQHKYDEFVDIAISVELDRCKALYYSEKLDQVIEHRDLVQIGEL